MRKIILLILFVLIFPLFLNADFELSLKKCIELAIKNNKELQKAREDVGIYKQEYRNIRGRLFPQISLMGGYEYKHTELAESALMSIPELANEIYSEDDLSGAISHNDSIFIENDEIIASFIDQTFSEFVPKKIQKETSAFSQIKLEQVIFMGGKLINGINIASKLYHLQEKKYFLVEQDIIYAAIDKYYQAKLSQKIVKIKEEALDVAQKHLIQVNDMYKEGLVSEYDLLRAKLEVKKLQPDVLIAQKNYTLSIKGLKNYLNFNQKENLNLTTEIKLDKIELNYDINEAIVEGLKNRMEIELADISVDVEKVNLRYEKGNFLPEIGFSVEYNYFGQNETKICSDDWGNYYKLGIGISMPIFTGLSNSAKKAKARHNLKRAILEKQSLEEKIELDIINSYLQLKADLENVKTQKENIKLAMKGLKIAEVRYENQLADQLEIFDAQLMLNSTKLNYLNAVYSSIMSYEKLKKAMGRNLYN